LEQALVIASELGDDRIGTTFCSMGDVLVAQEGREKEAILMFQKCVVLFEEEDASDLMRVFLKLGQAYTKIEAWYDAIASLEKGLSIADSIEDERFGNQLKAAAKRSLGNTYLEKYESFSERNDELIRKALFFVAACNLPIPLVDVDLFLFLDLAQEHYFLGDSEKAHAALKKYLDGTVRLGASHCQSCGQICAKDAIMEKCSVCKVARYCSQAHSIQAWKKGRLCHKVMCPLLKRWRKITEGKGTTTEVRDELFNDFFERVLASKPK
jgi:rubrerythrin